VRVGELGGDVKHELRIVVQDVVANLRFIMFYQLINFPSFQVKDGKDSFTSQNPQHIKWGTCPVLHLSTLKQDPKRISKAFRFLC